MPTSYSTTVTVAGFGSADYGSMLDSLEIVSGSVVPYELPQPASGRAAFLGLPVVSGVTQTPDWWLGKELTFTITPQGATGTVTWVGIVQAYNCSPVEHSATTQIVELDLLSPTAKISTQIIQKEFFGGAIAGHWYSLDDDLEREISRITWAEAPAGLTWAAATTTWAGYTNNFTGISFAWDDLTASDLMYLIPTSSRDILTFITDIMSTKYKGWMWFDDTSVTFNAPSTGYLNYSQITSLDATSCILWNSLNASQNLNNVINNAGIYNAKDATTYSYLDSTSYAEFGDRYIDLNPCYEGDSPTLAQSIVTDKINAYKQPNKYLQSLTVDLDKLTHVTSEWQNFYKSTKPVRLPITNIPAAYGGDHTYMVRGVTLNLTNKHAEATLVVVPSTIYNPS